MADADTGSVECPICGEPFDPTAAGGWCTNPECGEWQYTDETEAEDTPAEGDRAGSSPSETESERATDGTDESEPGVDSDDAEDTDGAGNEEGEAEPEAPEPTAGSEEAGDGEDASDDADGAAPGEERAAETTPSTGDEPEPDEPVPPEGDEGSADEPATVDCPDCGTELDADANFCVECGADVQDVTLGPEPLTECPGCGADVGEADNFCVNCGEDLDAHRPGSDDESGSSSDAPTEDEAAEHVAALSEAADDEPVPERLVLEVRGQEITAEDGDQVGREVRAALTDAGRPEDEAIRVHREHVRFVREADAFYLVDLGDNPTRLNGQPLQKGDREPVEPGDELELSGVATLTVRAP